MTIGHSTHDFAAFIELLQKNQVTAVADVRSAPASQFAPQFNRRSLDPGLHASGLKYVFLGKELGARTEDTTCYVDGRVQYSRLAQTHAFASGIERLIKGARRERIAIMCTEGEPLNCHRTVLISRVLTQRGVTIHHIHGDGRVESHDAAMERLMAKFGLADPELFRTPAERLEEALSRQEERIAYVNQELHSERAADA
ncbi:DUF488 family protein [Streptomyces rubradiris]|uniref:DUF488 domain-containing protein n=1 Tax=Streptomyces rubradiris TaxID=285531 RepID=A0ABQ3RMS1_STRRR|nr:DUF488 domain-containing protein [Streptomyces rubradiris]GHH02848.1 hypothetical protein GCM10018792_19060 [Streptomyces rubradiris]GHI57155.1 hypothetical protein Srubr_70010 [Streptomyces rubradiris]